MSRGLHRQPLRTGPRDGGGFAGAELTGTGRALACDCPGLSLPRGGGESGVPSQWVQTNKPEPDLGVLRPGVSCEGSWAVSCLVSLLPCGLGAGGDSVAAFSTVVMALLPHEESW